MIVLGVLTPVFVFAQTTPSSEQTGEAINIPNTLKCQAFTTLQDQFKIRFSLMEDTLTYRVSVIEERLQKRNTTEISEIIQSRITAKEDRDIQFAEMRKNAKTENNQVAVEAYIAFIELAYTDYQKIIDNNIETSKNVDELMLQYYQILNYAILNYRTSILSSINNGQIVCLQGESISEIYSTIKLSNESARLAYDNTIKKEAVTIKEGILSLLSMISQSEEIARRTLKESVDDAYQKLQHTLAPE